MSAILPNWIVPDYHRRLQLRLDNHVAPIMNKLAKTVPVPPTSTSTLSTPPTTSAHRRAAFFIEDEAMNPLNTTVPGSRHPIRVSPIPPPPSSTSTESSQSQQPLSRQIIPTTRIRRKPLITYHSLVAHEECGLRVEGTLYVYLCGNAGRTGEYPRE